ncbi:hypothetical protein Tdes44962_MAKER08064 [Teratosphaeria destructans]|uniref:Uncharacterized protein n=1 Tax=Teratosphaeria destructans TaxID=418781 RepID=A0A9W7SXQ7_9PEZI|nr:hypothetical protein Tdes44962_MAKER08064 [Teratosphaeria destructans]
MRSFALLPLAFAAISLAVPVAEEVKPDVLKRTDGPTGCVEHCPPNPLGGTYTADAVKSFKASDGGAKAVAGADSLASSKTVSTSVSSYVYGFWVYSYVEKITTSITITFNQQLINCGVQPSTSIVELLEILHLEEEATIEALILALLGADTALVSQLLAIISYIFLGFGLTSETTIIAFINACGITTTESIYILFIKMGIWSAGCPHC